MSVYSDLYKKAKGWNQPITITAEDHAEKLTCSLCGKQYVSRGRFDPGICRECEKEKNAHCVGGVCDGEMAHDQ